MWKRLNTLKVQKLDTIILSPGIDYDNLHFQSVEEDDMLQTSDILSQLLTLTAEAPMADMSETLYVIPSRLDPLNKGKVQEKQENQYKAKEEKAKEDKAAGDKKNPRAQKVDM